MSNNQAAIRKIQPLLETKELPSLGPEQRSGRVPIKSLESKMDGVFSETNVLPATQTLIRSLVLLWHDHLDESHSISQEIHSADGSLLHGIMHRREPDYGNAKYWFHRVGEHPCFPIIAERSGNILDDANYGRLKTKLIQARVWDAFAFVDACENAIKENDKPAVALLERVQEIEFKTLLEHFLR